MGHAGRITSLDELPSRKVLTGYIKKAMRLNEQGIKSPTRTKRAPKPEATVPKNLGAALGKNKKARATFDNFSRSHPATVWSFGPDRSSHT